MVPGFKDETYISNQKGWYEDAQNKHNAILTGIKKDLVDNRFEILYKYTMGLGNTGIEREAYYLGWITVGKALEDGYTFNDVTRRWS